MWTVNPVRWRSKIVPSLLPNNKLIWRHNFPSSWTHFKSLACTQVNLTRLTVHLNYVKQRVDIFKLLSVSDGRIGRQRQLKRLGRQPRPRRMMIECAFMKLKGRKLEESLQLALGTRLNPDTIVCVWTWKLLNPERKSCGFKYIRISVDGALVIL